MSILKQIAFILSAVVLATIVGYLVFAWTEPTEAPPEGNVPAPINVGSNAQIKQGALQINADLTANRLLDSSDNSYYVDPANSGYAGLFAGKVGIGTETPGAELEVAGNIIASSPIANNHVATKEYVDAASGSACPANYGNLCLNGGGLQFTYSGKTLYIDAFPRSTYILGGTGYESQYGLAWQHCERIGARLATLAEWQAACSALGGPSGNGLTTFGGSISNRGEWTATPYSSGANYAMLAGNGSCSDSGYNTVDTQSPDRWFRCVR
jgi:hypothetical protein